MQGIVCSGKTKPGRMTVNGEQVKIYVKPFYAFYRETYTKIPSGNGVEFHKIAELKHYVSTAYDNVFNWNEPGYKWEIEKSWMVRGKWRFAVVERGNGKPPWVDKYACVIVEASKK